MELYSLLPILMISNKKVNNQKVNYEEYLIELINSSYNYFLKLTNSEKFCLVQEQSHGECDAKTSNYEIDFKLLVPTEFMFYKNYVLPNLDYHLDDGYITITNNEKSLNKNLQSQANNAFVNYVESICLSNKEKLLKIKDDDTPLSSSIKNMLVNKNLLIFIPCIFNNQLNSISLIKKLFNPIISLRDEVDKETYITFLHGNHFQIIKYEKGEYKLIDVIHKIMLPTFTELYRLTNFI